MKLFNKKLNNTTTQRGWMSMEMMFVLAMVAVVTTFVIFYFYKLNQDRKANEVIDLVTLINKKVQELYAQDSTFENLDNSLLINTGALNKANVSGQDIKNAWKGNVVVTVNDSDTSTYDIEIQKIPNEQCSKIAGSFRNQVITMSIGSGKITNPTDTSAVKLIVTECAKGNDNNTIKLNFK